MSEELKAKIIALWREGVPVTTIADDLGCTRKTVYLWTRRWDREGTVRSRASRGRPRKTTPAQDQALVDAVKYQQLVNTRTLAAPFEVSRSTIRRRLEESGVIQPRKDLTPAEKNLRLEYAHCYLDYDFEGVAFIDEKLFVAKADALELHSTSRSETSHVNIGFWGWMNASGPIKLCDLAGRLNSQRYLDLLRDVFLPSARTVYPDGPKIVFTQELSTHKRKKVEAWIESQGDLELIRLPPKSPDLNPMEDVWNVIVKGYDSTVPPTSDQLWAYVRQQWDKLRGTDFCSSLVKSMKDRLQAVIDADGGKQPAEGAEPKTSIRKTIELDPTKIRVVMLNPEEQFRQYEEESKAKFPFQCHLCYKGFNFDTKLENHMRKHSPSRGPFSCSLCSMYFPTAYSHSVHSHIHTRRYECCACGRRMIDRASIMDHYRTQHEGIVSHFTCHLCGKVSNNSKTHRGHMRNHHSGQRPECEQCGKTFVNKDSLEEHMQIHQGIKNYSCSECGKLFRTRTQIKHHQLKHTDVKEYYCVECDVRFKSAHSLRQHLVKSLKHKDKGSLKFECTRCDKRYATARALAQHALVQHEGVRAHACPACPAALASRAALARHARHVHAGARPAPRHVCHACGRAFRGKSVLTNHVRTHTGEKPFACATCGRKFSQRAALRTHVDLVHLKRRRGKAKQELELTSTETPKLDLFTKEEPQVNFDSWNRPTNIQNCEVYFTVTAAP